MEYKHPVSLNEAISKMVSEMVVEKINAENVELESQLQEFLAAGYTHQDLEVVYFQGTGERKLRLKDKS